MILILLNLLTYVNCKLIAPRRVIYAVDCGGIVDMRSEIGVKFLKVNQI